MRKDPLVINFGGTAAQLTDQKFAFDIDSDGAEDSISFVGGASGFLAASGLVPLNLKVRFYEFSKGFMLILDYRVQRATIKTIIVFQSVKGGLYEK